jgi:hypothetical protein
MAGAQWTFSIRGDAGTGGSDFAWFGNAGIGYRFSPKISALLGYRILSLDHEGGANQNYFKYDVTMDGVGLALGFEL